MSDSFLDRVIDTTEHHEHAVEEKPIWKWNTRVYPLDLTPLKLRYETQQWPGDIHLKGSTDRMSVFQGGQDQFEFRLLYEPADTGTQVTMTVNDRNGHDLTEQSRDMIVTCLGKIERFKPQARPMRLTSTGPGRATRITTFAAAVGLLIIVLWALAAMNVASDQAPATAKEASPTPTPTLEKAEPRRATPGRRR